LRDSAGNAPEVGTTGEPGNFNQVDNPVYFVGGNARAAYGGNDVPIYAPLTFAPGSSLAHLNEAQFASYVMSYSIAPGQYNRTLSSLEWGVFEDIGWILPGVVPEPGTAVVILATSLLALRRRAARQPAP